MIHRVTGEMKTMNYFNFNNKIYTLLVLAAFILISIQQVQAQASIQAQLFVLKQTTKRDFYPKMFETFEVISQKKLFKSFAVQEFESIKDIKKNKSLENVIAHNTDLILVCMDETNENLKNSFEAYIQSGIQVMRLCGRNTDQGDESSELVQKPFVWHFINDTPENMAYVLYDYYIRHIGYPTGARDYYIIGPSIEVSYVKHPVDENAPYPTRATEIHSFQYAKDSVAKDKILLIPDGYFEADMALASLLVLESQGQYAVDFLNAGSSYTPSYRILNNYGARKIIASGVYKTVVIGLNSHRDEFSDDSAEKISKFDEALKTMFEKIKELEAQIIVTKVSDDEDDLDMFNRWSENYGVKVLLTQAGQYELDDYNYVTGNSQAVYLKNKATADKIINYLNIPGTHD